MGYRIPERTLPPSLVLVRRLFLSVKFISCNILYLFIILTLVVNITSHVLIDSLLFQPVWFRVGVMVFVLRHLHAQDCPAWATGITRQPKEKYLRVSFF